MAYKRLLLKLSGEALANGKGHGIDYDYLTSVCNDIKKLIDEGYEIGIVVGGGNFWRGRSNQNMDSVTADYIGMLATIMNAMALSDTFRVVGVDSSLQSSININGMTESFSKEKCLKYLQNKGVVIFGGGTGSPFFSTDSAASLRALEIEADLIVKLTNVDGVYDLDPKIYKEAKMYDEITYQEVIEKNLKVMDISSISLCKEHDMPIIVTNINNLRDLPEVLNGKKEATLVRKR